MAFIKDWFRHEDNKTGCRFIVVDAYNEEKVLKYYDKNGFLPLYKTEEIEKQYYDIPQDAPLKTRLLYFDLKKDWCNLKLIETVPDDYFGTAFYVHISAGD